MHAANHFNLVENGHNLRLIALVNISALKAAISHLILVEARMDSS